MEKRLSTDPYKGVRDFYPEDQAQEQYFFGVWRRVAESFGYVEYGASPLEPSELYEAKSSQEIVAEQTYTFEDRGKRRVTLRPEMTPTLARMVAGRRRELPLPLRWFSIPNVFRYERPQRGRLREHWQLNCDLFGVAGVEAEVELISLASAILRAFGAMEGDFEFRVNDREALEKLFAEQGIEGEKARAMRRLLDKRDKMENFDELAEKLLGKPFNIHAIQDAAVSALIERLAAAGIGNVRHDPSLVRGFDYYTGIVFEVFDTAPENNRSLFGGGRYDNLLEVFGAEKLPAAGFGMGDVTLRDFLESRKLLPAYRSPTELLLCTIGDEAASFAYALAEALRAQELRVAVDPTERKIGDKIKTANKQRIPFIVALGADEMHSGSFTLKELASGAEVAVGRADIASFIKAKRA